MLKVVCVHEGFIIFSAVSFNDVYDFVLLSIYSTIFTSKLFQKYPVFYYLCLQLKDHRFLELMLVCQLIILAKLGYFSTNGMTLKINITIYMLFSDYKLEPLEIILMYANVYNTTLYYFIKMGSYNGVVDIIM